MRASARSGANGLATAVLVPEVALGKAKEEPHDADAPVEEALDFVSCRPTEFFAEDFSFALFESLAAVLLEPKRSLFVVMAAGRLAVSDAPDREAKRFAERHWDLMSELACLILSVLTERIISGDMDQMLHVHGTGQALARVAMQRISMCDDRTVSVFLGELLYQLALRGHCDEDEAGFIMFKVGWCVHYANRAEACWPLLPHSSELWGTRFASLSAGLVGRSMTQRFLFATAAELLDQKSLGLCVREVISACAAAIRTGADSADVRRDTAQIYLCLMLDLLSPRNSTWPACFMAEAAEAVRLARGLLQSGDLARDGIFWVLEALKRQASRRDGADLGQLAPEAAQFADAVLQGGSAFASSRKSATTLAEAIGAKMSANQP